MRGAGVHESQHRRIAKLHRDVFASLRKQFTIGRSSPGKITRLRVALALLLPGVGRTPSDIQN
jgi:hypothetical protein